MIVLGTPVCLPCIVEDYGCKAVLDAQEVEVEEKPAPGKFAEPQEIGVAELEAKAAKG